MRTSSSPTSPNSAADRLRADLLRSPPGRVRPPRADPARAGSVIDRRVAELLARELDPELAAPESVVRVPRGAHRVDGAQHATVFLIVAVVLVVVIGSIAATIDRDLLWTLFTLVPIAFGFGSYLVNRILKYLRYSIAGTRYGVRVGYGLLSTRNETVPPGRIHSVAVSQSLMWRPFGWWTVRVNRASRGSSTDSQQSQSTSVLPVGTVDDVARVLELLLPEWSAEEGPTDSRRPAERARGPRRRRRLHDVAPASRRRAVVLASTQRHRDPRRCRSAAARGGVARVRRRADPRLQSVSIEQGPLGRGLRLASLNLHTVAGPSRRTSGRSTPPMRASLR